MLAVIPANQKAIKINRQNETRRQNFKYVPIAFLLQLPKITFLRPSCLKLK